MSNIVSSYQIFGAPSVPVWRDIIMDTSGTAFSAFTVVDFDVKITYDPLDANPTVVTVYSGRAHKRPGASYIEVRLNDIVAGFLRGEPQPLADTYDLPGKIRSSGVALGGLVKIGTQQHPSILKTSIVWKDPAGVVASETESVAVENDWTYQASEAVANAGLYPMNDRISNTIEARQAFCLALRRCRGVRILRVLPVPGNPGSSYSTLFWSAMPSDPALEAELEQLEETAYSLENDIQRVSLELERARRAGDQELVERLEYELMNLDAQLREIMAAETAVHAQMDALDPLESGPVFVHLPNLLVFPEGEYDVLVSYNEDGETKLYGIPFFKVERSRSVYTIHYLNANGGWDSLAIRGKVVETKNLERTSYERGGRTTGQGTLYEAQLLRRKTVLESDMVRHFEMHTHWLTPREAMKMFHLLNSPDVWVERVDGCESAYGLSGRSRFLPAVLTGSSFDEKAYFSELYTKGDQNEVFRTPVPFQTDPGKLIQYQIDLDIAVNYRRR